jgi:hypothetical protein
VVDPQAQNIQSRAASADHLSYRKTAPNGGSARGYQELSAPLGNSDHSQQADGQAVYFMHRRRWT